MKIRYTSRAERDILRVDEWWREHRPASAELFWNELYEGLKVLQTAPNGAPIYPSRRREVVRRIVLPKTRHHVYFWVDAEKGAVMVIAVWSAVRGRGPRI